MEGDILVSVLIFATVAITMTSGLVTWGSALVRSVRNVAQREQALQIAEAGIDYYRWHLAHAPSDFQDGTGTSTPTTHTLADKDGNTIGSYTLTITPPAVGSTIVTIVSKGTVASTTIARTIKAVLAIPSFAQYAAIANDNMYFGSGTVVNGPVHSNGGIHFDGVANNIVTSATSTYTDPDTGLREWGVYTTSGTDDPAPPTALPVRADVFKAGRQLAVPAVSFAGLTADMGTLKSLGQASNGLYFGPSSKSGYHLTFKSNNTFDLKKVTALISAPSGCSYAGSPKQWGTWSINTEGAATNYPIPANGVIFIEDDVWVDGTVNGSRATVAASRFTADANSYANITVNSDLLYSHTDGTDVIGLLAEGNVNAGMVSNTTLNVDAALVAQKGRVGRFYYNSSCAISGVDYSHRTTLNLLGMIGTNIRYGFAYTDGTGYTNRNITYDGNLLYGPPPSFPLTSSYYSTLSWQEI